jgi:adenylylsulfate kinase-like enzyme
MLGLLLMLLIVPVIAKLMLLNGVVSLFYLISLYMRWYETTKKNTEEPEVEKYTEVAVKSVKIVNIRFTIQANLR